MIPRNDQTLRLHNSNLLLPPNPHECLPPIFPFLDPFIEISFEILALLIRFEIDACILVVVIQVIAILIVEAKARSIERDAGERGAGTLEAADA